MSETPTLTCGIALGSNMGDRLKHLLDARAAVERLNTGAVSALISPVYETEPVDCEPGSAAYLNAVMELQYEGAPVTLLGALQELELILGRPSQHPRNAPRTIDLDLLYAGSVTLHGDDLVIPHPRLHTRRFVLQPLADIRPELVLPGFHEPILSLLRKLPSGPTVTRVFNAWPHKTP
jgi:2-amino-4-hydroxy-6-hydroxymethyldihydropteridine diphosphokinase